MFFACGFRQPELFARFPEWWCYEGCYEGWCYEGWCYEGVPARPAGRPDFKSDFRTFGLCPGRPAREAPGCLNGYPQKAREGVSGTGLLRGPKSPRRCIGKGSRRNTGNVPGTCREFKFRISRPNPKSRIQKTAKTRFQNEQKTKIIYRSTISKHKKPKTQPSFFKLLYIVRLSLPRGKDK
jgi:hypothetical protein